MNSLRIWTNFPPLRQDATTLRQAVAPHEMIISSVRGPDPSLAPADIAFGQPDPEQVMNLPQLKWIHLNTAGYTQYDRQDLREALHSRGIPLTNSSSVFDQPCAEHALAMILALSRGLPQALDNQRSSRDWPAGTLRDSSRLLGGQTILLVGFGAIGQRLADLLKPFNAKVIAFRRKPRGDEPVPCHEISTLDQWLPSADHVVNLLPASHSTNQFFDADRFAKMKHSACFYNIGRGTTVDQMALRVVLETRRIQSAFIDVMTPEPLPPDDPLWTTPHCYITPHTAGGHLEENRRVVEHFVENLRRFERNQPLRDRIF
jgi:phosphoglycerate dehydrogenase-like enzyme